MNILKSLISLKTFVVVAVLGILLFGGVGLTASVAQRSIPGDTLYPLKVNMEIIQQNLADDEGTVELELLLAGKRLEEIEKLIREKRFDRVAQTASKFDQHIMRALEAIQRLSQEKPDRAAELNQMVAQQLSRYSEALSVILVGLPEDLQKILFNTSQSAEILVKSLSDSRGMDNENENENANMNSNSNSNLNSNENENINVNANENANDNENANQNSNDNENTNGNENENLNRNDNEKEDNRIRYSFKGRVETIMPDVWIISNVSFQVDKTTRIEGQIKVGDWVEVKFIKANSGSRLAVKIEKVFAPNLTNSNGNENSRENENRNGNSNDNGSLDDNGKYDNDNEDSNENENEKD